MVSASPDTPRALGVAGALALAPLLAAAWLVALEVTLGPPYVVPDSSSLSAAVALDRIEVAFAHIRSGVDPNAPVPFQDDRFTGGREIMLTPLLIAVAYDYQDSVGMLMSSGVRMHAPGNRFAVCLARQLGHDRLAEKMIKDAGPEGAPFTCPDSPPPDEAPLSAYVE